METALKNGTLKVFDCSKFTVGGENVTSCAVDFPYMDRAANPPRAIYMGEIKEIVKTENDVTYIDECSLRVAPDFSLIIDGIILLAWQ